MTYYYPPVAYWTTSLLRFGAENDPFGWRPLGISAVLAVMASGLTCYLWLVRTVDRRSALIASLTYQFLPYHTAIDLYERGALSELWTFVWMPPVLFAVDAVVARRRFAVPGLALGYALLVLTHLPTTLIFSLIPVVYSFYVAPESEKRRALLLTTAGMTLGVGLAAIYLLPAMMMQEFIFHTTEGIGGHYYFGSWFLFSNLKWSGSGSEYFQATTGVVVAAFVAFAIIRLGPTAHFKQKTGFWFAVLLFCFFMMTPLSKPIWVLLPTLQKVQFPFRFNTVLSLAVAPLTAFASFHFKIRSKWSAPLLVVFVLLAGSSIFATAMRAYYAYPVHHVDRVVLDAYNNRLMQRRDTNEFRPRWVVSIDEQELDALLQRIGQSGGKLNKANIIQGEGAVAVEEWTPRRIVLRTNTPAEAALNVSQFYFPGWFVTLDDLSEKHAVQPSKPCGLIRVVAPAGQHRLILQLGKRMPEVAGGIISGASLVIWLGLTLWLYWCEHRNRHRGPLH